MRLGDVERGAWCVTRAGRRFLVLGHEDMKTLALGSWGKEIPFGGQLVRVNEWRTTILSADLDVTPVGQLSIPFPSGPPG